MIFLMPNLYSFHFRVHHPLDLLGNGLDKDFTIVDFYNDILVPILLELVDVCHVGAELPELEAKFV